MTTVDKITDEKLQYDINRKEAKVLALSSGKIDKYGYLTGEEILPSNQKQIIEQAKFTYSHSKFTYSKDDHKDIYKEIFDKTVKEKFDEIKHLTYVINHDYLTYYFEGYTAHFFYHFNNDIELF